MKNWMQNAEIKPGSLHKSLGVPSSKQIPLKVIQKATHTRSPKSAKQANLALTFKKMRAQKD